MSYVSHEHFIPIGLNNNRHYSAIQFYTVKTYECSAVK